MKSLIFVYLMTYGGSAAALFDPYLGLLIYIAFACLRPEGLWFYSVPAGGHYSRTLAIALLVGWALRGFGRWNFGQARPIVLALIGYLCWAGVSAMFAPVQALAWNVVEELLKIVLTFLVGITMIDSVHKLRQLAWVIAISCGFFAYECNLAYYLGWNLKEDGFAGLGDSAVAITMVCGAVVSFFLGLTSRSRLAKVAALGLAGLMIHVVLFSFGRGPMLGLIVTALLTLWLIPWKPAYGIGFVLLALLSFRLAGTEVRARFMTTFSDPAGRDASAQSRFELWRDCLDAIRKRPVFGIGPGHWALIAHEYGWPPGKEAHNVWLQVGAELGVPGLSMFVLFFGLCMTRPLRIARGRVVVTDPLVCDAARMTIAGTAGFVVASIFVTLWGLEVPYYLALIGAGSLKLSSQQKPVPRVPRTVFPTWRPTTLAATPPRMS